MLAQSKKMALVVALGVIGGLVVSTEAQQLPSQKYQPAPPSVHVPNQEAKRLPSGQFRDPHLASKNTPGQPISLAQYQAMLRATQASKTRPGYNLSDNGSRNLNSSQPVPTAQSYFKQKLPAQPGFESDTIQQTSFVDDQDSRQVKIPEALQRRENHSRRQEERPTTQQTAPHQTPGSVAPAAQPQPPQFQTPTVSNDFPRQNELSEIQAEISRRKMERESSAKTKAPSQAVNSSTAASQSNPAKVASTAPQQKNAEAPMVPDSNTLSRTSAKNELMLRAQPVPAGEAIQVATYEESRATEIIQQTSAVVEDDVPAMKVTTPQLRNVESETFRTDSTLSLSAPAIRVEAFGPKTIGINKTVSFEVKVSNIGQQAADRILVGIDLPAWVEIKNVSLTNGTKEMKDGADQARLVWTVDRVAVKSSQSLKIEAIPRKAEMFDMGVEWTLAPRNAVTAIEVTEPRLEMKISGPRDVLYGEKAIYHVAVRNTGTGVAENVTVMLPEALGGARASLENIPAGEEKNFQVELLARTAGELDLSTSAVGDGELSVNAKKLITVRRADLNLAISGPSMKYAGSTGQYEIIIANKGDATAADVTAALALPAGVKYLGGIDAVNQIEGGLRWPVGSLEPGDQRMFKINCELNTSGDVTLEAGTRGKGDLVAANQVTTKVETIADLVLSVDDPRGPLPTGEETTYQIRIKNRGSRVAREVDLVMQFSEGIEPTGAEGLSHRIIPGQVLFSAIEKIEPGQEITVKVRAQATTAGTRIFRAQLTCAESDSREIAEGTTRFFGDDVAPATTSENRETTAEKDDGSFQPAASDSPVRK